MVTVVKTPQGHKLTGTAFDATIGDAAGDALVTSTAHGLSTGDHVYIESDIDEYNGFWYVTISGVNAFKLSEYVGANFVEYFQDADISYYSTTPHEWSSIFLPIVYKLTNDRWPTNSVDTVRNVGSIGDDNGYLDVSASGTIKTGMNILEFVKIANSPVEEYNGVWQIVEVISNSRVVIDAPYTSESLTGATIQYYYNNYQVKVKVYAGLPAGHPWESRKPYEEVAELSFTPEDDNTTMFSVADYIKGKVHVRNNTLLYSLPLNLDAFTGFYISVAESYDDSDNYTITTNESAYADDTFEGYAMISKLPFKNTYGGDMSDYVWVEGSSAMWLTVMPRLMAVEDKYFDLSFIKNASGDFIVEISKYIADYLAETEEIEYDDSGPGVYRIPIEANSYYDSFCIRIMPVGSFETISFPALSTWATQSTSGSLVDWTTGATPSVAVSPSNQQSEIVYVDYAFVPGATYQISVDYTVLSGSVTLRLLILDSGYSTVSSQVEINSTGTYTISHIFTADATTVKVGMKAQTVNPLLSGSVRLDDVEAGSQIATFYYTEEICIDILESCEAQDGITPIDIRLLEDGSYRILE